MAFCGACQAQRRGDCRWERAVRSHDLIYPPAHPLRNQIMPFLREKLSAPILRLEISDDTFVTPFTSPVYELSPSQNTALREGSISNSTSLPPQPALPVPPPGISKARDESQKLLAHVLDQLRHRPKCPPSYPPQFPVALVAKSIIPRTSASRTTSEVQSLNPDDEDTSERAFSPDSAFDLMNRLRDVLMISLSRGWQIFSER